MRGALRGLLLCVGAKALVVRPSRVRARSALRGDADDADAPAAAAPVGAPRALPMTGIGTLAWVDDGASGTWDARDVGLGAAAFATAHVGALAVLGADAPVAVRLVGAAAFLASQALAGAPLAPTKRGVAPGDVARALDPGAAVPIEGLSPRVPWAAVSVGATVPLVLILGAPLVLAAPDGALAFDAGRLPALGDALEKVVAAPLTEGLVFQFWACEACRRAGLPYRGSVCAAGALFGAWHGAAPTSLLLAALGAYWAHLYAQTRSLWVPVGSHALWNCYALGVAACLPPL